MKEKFFANIDHKILTNILRKHISDENLIKLLKNIIGSFSSARKSVGLPLGNLTSQLFVNVYMNEFDQFVKHKLKTKYYIRYCDDFVILSDNREQLMDYIQTIKKFLIDKLKLELHPDKISIKTVASGIDFLGSVNFLDYRVLRTKTKKRILKKIKNNPQNKQSTNSYLGILKHCRGYKIQKQILSLLQH